MDPVSSKIHLKSTQGCSQCLITACSSVESPAEIYWWTTRSSSQNIQTGRTCSSAEAEEVLVSEESVQAGVGLTSLAHEAGEGDDALLASDFAVLVNLKAG